MASRQQKYNEQNRINEYPKSSSINEQYFPASTINSASINVPLGIDPLSPSSGDFWATAQGLYWNNGTQTNQISFVEEEAVFWALNLLYGEFQINPVGRYYTTIQQNIQFDDTLGWTSQGGGPGDLIVLNGGTNSGASVDFYISPIATNSPVNTPISVSSPLLHITS